MGKQSPTILALDLATCTGWAYGSPGAEREMLHGSIRFAERGATRGVILDQAHVWLRDALCMRVPDLVVFEKPLPNTFMKGATQFNTQRVLLGLCAITEQICTRYSINCREAKVSDIRHFFIGKNPRGDIGKKLTMERLQSMGFEPNDDNAADALALWYFAADQRAAWDRGFKAA